MADSKLDYIKERLDDVSDTCNRVDKELSAHKVAFEQHSRQDEMMYEELVRMNDILSSNTDSLKEHMQNNQLLKDMIAKMDERLSPIELQHIQRAAVKDWWRRNSVFAAKLLGAVTGAVTLAMLIKAGIVLLIR